MGYTETAVVVRESDGVAQLTVAISVPGASVTIGSSISISLFVNTSNGMSTGWCTLSSLSICTKLFCAQGVCQFMHKLSP